MSTLRLGIIIPVGLGLFCAALVVASCAGNNRDTKKQEEIKRFVLPTIPSMLLVPQERADYLVTHYWNHFDFSDTSLIHLPAYTEQAFRDYIDVLPHAPYASILASVEQTLSKATGNRNMFTHFIELFEKYLYNPNSPLRNEELYALAVEYVINSDQIDDTDKIRLRYQWEQIQKNRQGSVAADFSYSLISGAQERMHRIQADYLLLFLYDPDCHSCGEILQGIHASPVVGEAINRGILKVLAVYVAKDIERWEQYQVVVPKTWISAYDPLQTIEQEKLYDLRALPTMYLLDKQKRVLIKDAIQHQVDQLLVQELQKPPF
ncbi:MAG: DUF5106 domain-containing protein [Bacteroidales bacterium]|nr:DUF5106 domain-containing protein [Bacteroidales bacterium]